MIQRQAFGSATALAFALALAIVGAPRESQARTVVVTTQLDYAAAPGCPDVATFAAIVDGRLGYDPFRGEARDRVVVRIDPGGRAADGRIEGRIEWRNVNGRSIGEQQFPSRSGDCAELVRAMGFALALQIQLMAATVEETDAQQPPSPPAAAPLAPTMAPTTAPTTVAPAPAAQIASPPPLAPQTSAGARGPSLSAGGGVAAGLGVSSDPVAIGRLFVTAGWSHAAVELAAEASVPSTTHRADGAGFSQEELLASVAGCGVLSRWSACAVGKLGELRVAGQGVDVPLTASGLMIQAGVRLAAAQSLGPRTSVIAHAEGLERLTRGTITLDATPVWTTPRFAALFGVDVALRFR